MGIDEEDAVQQEQSAEASRHSPAAEASGQDLDSAGFATAGAGPILRKAREQLGLSIFEVSEKLYLTEHFVRALEAGDYGKLPSEVFVKGYMKSYALLLGVDVEQVMEAYRLAGSQAAIDTSQEHAAPARSGGFRVLLLILILAAAAGGWWAYQTFGAAAGFLAAGAAKYKREKQ